MELTVSFVCIGENKMGKFLEVNCKLEKMFPSLMDKLIDLQEALLRDWLNLKSNVKTLEKGTEIKTARSFYSLRQRVKTNHPELFQELKQLKNVAYMNANVMAIAWAIHAKKIYKARVPDKQICKFYRVSYKDYMAVKHWWERNLITKDDLRENFPEELIFTRPPKMSDIYSKWERKINNLIKPMMKSPKFKYVFDIYEDKEVFENILLMKALSVIFLHHYLDEDQIGRLLNNSLKNYMITTVQEMTTVKHGKHIYKNNKFELRTVSYDSIIKDKGSEDSYDFFKGKTLEPDEVMVENQKIDGTYNKEILRNILWNIDKSEWKSTIKFLKEIMENEIGTFQSIKLLADKYNVCLSNLRCDKIREFLEKRAGRASLTRRKKCHNFKPKFLSEPSIEVVEPVWVCGQRYIENQHGLLVLA